MKDVTFFLKLVGLTLVLVVLTQIQIGDRSVEAHAMSWVQTSAIAQPIGGIANGAAKVIRDAAGKIHSAVDRTRGKHKDGAKKPSRVFRWFNRDEPESTDGVGRD